VGEEARALPARDAWHENVVEVAGHGCERLRLPRRRGRQPRTDLARLGGGAGARAGEECSGGGGGGGVFVSPVGYIEVRDGAAQFKRIASPADLLAVVATAALATLAVKRLLAG
jgi:hypothetical protein